MDKYEWSEHGLLMLQDIENSIRSYGGRHKLLFSLVSEHHKGYTCNKADCDYCERFKLTVHEPKETKNPYLKRKLSTIVPQAKFQKRDFSLKNFKY